MNIRKFVPTLLATLALGLFSNFSARATVNVSIQPTNIVSLVGSNATFAAQVSASGGETITGYTWKLSTSNLPPFSVISGATNSTLTISNVQTTDAAFYFVSVSYNSGTNTNLAAVSTAVQLVVHDQARLTSQPQPLVRTTHLTASFSVTALGAQPLSYRWRDNGTNLTDGGRISGSASNVLTITGLITNDTGNYDVVVSNAFATVTSQTAFLTVLAPPAIVVAPTNLTVVAGNSAVFSMTASGSSPLTYQWRFNNTNLANGGRISGATANVLTITGVTTNDSGSYTLSISNAVGFTNTVPVTLTVLTPATITSPATASGQQGSDFVYVVTATGSSPITFGASSLPGGLTIDPPSGVISGQPTNFGVFNVTLYATNPAAVTSTNLLLTIVTDVPGINSPLSVIGQQGLAFSYSITASNNPTAYTAAGLPPGILFTPSTGTLSGNPILSGNFNVTITASNQFGGDSEVLTLNFLSDVPVITSALIANGTENANFTYTIAANNSPTSFSAVGLPLGLVVNPTNGVISGAPVVGGTNTVTITAGNAYGSSSTNLVLRIAYTALKGLGITSVTASYSSPYLLDFTFSLRDDPTAGTNPSAGNAVVRPPEQLVITPYEGNIQTSALTPLPNETAFVVGSASTSKLLKTFFVLDYTFSMFITSGAIDQMQASVIGLINEEPASAQFGVEEFSADYVPPVQVIGFTSDKVKLNNAVLGIQTNFVQGNYGGTRFYDAMAAALTNFTTANPDEEHYIVVMSDGYDDSSVLAPTTNMSQADIIVNLATNNGVNVKIYCVGFGPSPNTNVLLQLANQTGGNYYAAATPADLQAQFSLLLKDIQSQYSLRWATLQRTSYTFQPMFQVSLAGQTASFNTTFQVVPYMTNINTNMSPPVTNILFTNTSLVPFYLPTNYAGNVQVGALRLVADSDTNISSVTLRAFYVPRFVREFSFHYRANYPCTVSILNTNTNQFLAGWTYSVTNDTNGGQFITLSSTNLTNINTSLTYGGMGDMLKFQFPPQAVPTSTNAFAFFTVDNTIYSNLPPGGQSFTMTNTNAFVTNLPVPPPHGTPVPWLISYGFTNSSNYAAVELSSPNSNGLPVWQDYIAGLNPTNPASKFIVGPLPLPPSNQPPVITFNSVLGRTYRVDTTVDLMNWFPLLDGISGTGSPISIPDNRNLSGAQAIYYRVAVSYH